MSDMMNQAKVEEKTVEQLLGLINEMAVSESVKKAVNDIVKNAQEKVSTDARGPLHMLFKGSESSCMKEVAGILGALYKQLGILTDGHVVECNRTLLVSIYVGQTAYNTQKSVNAANGGILFVDEAYELAESGDYLAMEAIDAILCAMEYHKDNLMVIFAGQSEKIDEFMAKCPAIVSRLSYPSEISFEE